MKYKKGSNRGVEFDISNENPVVYDFDFIQNLNESGKHPFPFHMDTLPGRVNMMKNRA